MLPVITEVSDVLLTLKNTYDAYGECATRLRYLQEHLLEHGHGA